MMKCFRPCHCRASNTAQCGCGRSLWDRGRSTVETQYEWCSAICKQESSFVVRDSLVPITGAGDEGEGVGAAAFLIAPKRSALRQRELRARPVSLPCRTWTAVARLQRCWATTSPETSTFTARPRLGERLVNDAKRAATVRWRHS